MGIFHKHTFHNTIRNIPISICQDNLRQPQYSYRSTTILHLHDCNTIDNVGRIYLGRNLHWCNRIQSDTQHYDNSDNIRIPTFLVFADANVWQSWIMDCIPVLHDS